MDLFRVWVHAIEQKELTAHLSRNHKNILINASTRIKLIGLGVCNWWTLNNEKAVCLVQCQFVLKSG